MLVCRSASTASTSQFLLFFAAFCTACALFLPFADVPTDAQSTFFLFFLSPSLTLAHPHTHSHAQIMTAVILLVTLLFSTSGFMVPFPEMHWAYAWIVYINPLAYAFALCMHLVFDGESYPCVYLSGSGLAGSNDTATPSQFPEYCGDGSSSSSRDGFVPGSAVIEQFGIIFSADVCWIAIFVNVVIWRLLAFAILNWKWVIQPGLLKLDVEDVEGGCGGQRDGTRERDGESEGKLRREEGKKNPKLLKETNVNGESVKRSDVALDVVEIDVGKGT